MTPLTEADRAGRPDRLWKRVLVVPPLKFVTRVLRQVARMTPK